MIFPLSGPGPHPALVAVLTDSGSAAHLAGGVLAGILDAPYSVAALAAFTGYQVSQAQTGEPWQRTGGELMEFAFGILCGALLKKSGRR